jgi:flagellar biosynthesis protein FlhG
MARVITFISATQNIGKTHMVVNIALQLGAMGHSACIFNSDSDTATIPNLLGIHPRYSLIDLIRNRNTLDNILTKGANDIDYFPGNPGMESLSGVGDDDTDRVVRSFLELNRFDFFLLDTFPGLSRNVSAFCKASSELILVMTSEPASLTESYGLLKSLSIDGFEGPVMVLINKSRDVKAARRSYGKFKEAVQKQLPVTLMPLGTVFRHRDISSPLKCPFILQNHQSDASKCIENIAQHLVEKKAEDLAVSAFLSRFLGQLKLPFQLGGIKKPHRQMMRDAEETPDVKPSTQSDGVSPDIQMVQDLLNRLLGRMDTIADALNDIKGMLAEQKQTAAMTAAPAEPLARNDMDKRHRVTLDFDAYLRQRTGN